VLGESRVQAPAALQLLISGSGTQRDPFAFKAAMDPHAVVSRRPPPRERCRKRNGEACHDGLEALIAAEEEEFVFLMRRPPRRRTARARRQFIAHRRHSGFEVQTP